jgi:formylglycine-generating enzyme required for sulfatase activity
MPTPNGPARCRTLLLAIGFLVTTSCTTAGTTHEPLSSMSSFTGMVAIEGGDWIDEGGARRSVDDFLLDRLEVSAGDYRACVRAGVCSERSAPSDGNETRRASHGCRGARYQRYSLPVNCVTVRQAAEYCTWRAKRLPTALEWMWAVRGGDQGRPMPWGSGSMTCARANVLGCEDGLRRSRLRGVDSQTEGASRHGLLNLIGNVAEMVMFENETFGVVGGSYYLPLVWGEYLDYTVHFQWKMKANEDRAFGSDVGFRCAHGER